MNAKDTETDKVDQNPPITTHEHNLLTPLGYTLLFSKRSAAVIDSSEKRNDWLNLELHFLQYTVRNTPLKQEAILILRELTSSTGDVVDGASLDDTRRATDRDNIFFFHCGKS